MSDTFEKYPPPSSDPAVPTADATSNATHSQVTGNKTDAAVVVVGTTKSVIAYVKGILTTVLTLMVAPTSTETSTITDTTFGGTFVQIVAASAAAIKAITLSGSVYNTTADATYKIEIATGAGGAEVVCATHFTRVTTAITMYAFFLSVRLNKAASTRIAYKATQSSGTSSFHAGYTIEEA